MIVKPKVRGFICVTSHPKGCEKNVAKQIEYVKSQGKIDGPKKVLVIGSSTGYGLASRIVSSFGSDAKTIGVFFERPGDERRTATAGYYNTVAFEKACKAAGLYAKSINGDAFSHDIKKQCVDLIKKDLGKVDCVIYSLASPKRMHPDSGKLYSSVLKTIGEPFENKTIDTNTNEVKQIRIESASKEEIEDTTHVMGGDDWSMWIDLLLKEDCLEEGALTAAYSYIGPKLTYPIYREGTIGKAKEHLEKTCASIQEKLASIKGKAFVSVNKALVTQSSSAIPVVPLYIALLYKVMKEKGTQEGCIEQIYRLYKNFLYSGSAPVLDSKGRVRIDDLEMEEDVQSLVEERWNAVTTENIYEISDYKGYQKEFLQLFGYELDGIDYEEDVEIDQQIGK